MLLKTAKRQANQIILFFLSLWIGSFLISGCVTIDRNTSQPWQHPIGKATNRSIPRSVRSGLAVLKFVNTTPRQHANYFQPWEYGIAAMLSTDLEETAMFNIVDRVRLNDILREQDLQVSGLVDQRTAVVIGNLIAARYILTGSFMVVGKELRIMAQVFSVEKGIQLGAISVSGKTDNFFLVEKDLFANAVKTLQIILNDEKQAKIMRTIETKSVGASLKNYSGEMAMLKANEMKKLGKKKDSTMYRNDAIQKFREALNCDPRYERAKKNLARLIMAIPMTL